MKQQKAYSEQSAKKEERNRNQQFCLRREPQKDPDNEDICKKSKAADVADRLHRLGRNSLLCQYFVGDPLTAGLAVIQALFDGVAAAGTEHQRFSPN